MPRKLIDEPDFRIVETEVGENIIHTLEVRDGVDAMGVEKWRTFRTDSKDLKAIFGYLIRVSLELEAMSEHRQRIPEHVSQGQ